MQVVYNKLVRDKIPEIITQSGRTCEYKTITNNEDVIGLLEKKLLEECNEYMECKNIEELADLLEVIFSLVERLGTAREELLRLANQKAAERGSFKSGLLLMSVRN